MVAIDVLIENSACAARPELKAEHGISLLIDTGRQRLMFDSGRSGVVVENAEKMGVDLRNVETVVLSHGHIDHGGGMARFFEINDHAPVYMKEQAKGRFFVQLFLTKHNVSLESQLFELYGDRIRAVTGKLEIGEGIFLLPDIQRSHPNSRTNRLLFMEKNGRQQLDDFAHEQMLVIVEPDGLVVVTGCSHNGVDNMAESAMRAFPGLPIKALIGGFHLMGMPLTPWIRESRANILALAERLKSYRIGTIYTGHCTAIKNFEIMKTVLGETLVPIHTGDHITI